MDDRNSLTFTLRLRGRPVVFVGEGTGADEQRRALERAGARIVREGSKAMIAVVVDDPAAVSRMKVRGLLVYAVGRPDLSDISLATPSERDEKPKATRAPSVDASRFAIHETVPSAPPKNVRAEYPHIDAANAAADAGVEAGIVGGEAGAGAYVAGVVGEDLPSETRLEARQRVRKRRTVKEPPVARIKAPRVARIKEPRIARVKPPAEGPGAIHKAVAALARSARALVAFIGMLARQCLRVPLFLVRPFMAVPIIVTSAIQTRLSRSRETPLALSLALAKGGPLDPLAGENRPDTGAPEAHEALSQAGAAETAPAETAPTSVT